jgi:CheY-like chemotaxis protein
MDLQMPVMDGYQATRLIRATPALANLPVVALTAGAFREQEQAAREAGMVGFLSKPFDVDLAIELILCTRCPQPAHGASRAGSDGVPYGVPDCLPDSASPSNVIDGVRGVQLCADRQAYGTYLRRFVDSYGEASGAIAASLAVSDRAAAAALAHKLAGVAGNLALPDTYRLACAVERALASEDDPAPALDGLRLALLQAVAAIEQFAPLAVPASVPEPEALAAAQSPIGLVDLEALLSDLMLALDGDDPEPVEPLLTTLARHVSKKQLETIASCVRDFDFRGAEAGTSILAEELGCTLRTGTCCKPY